MKATQWIYFCVPSAFDRNDWRTGEFLARSENITGEKKDSLRV